METIIEKTWTEKMIMSLPKNGNKYELINGEFIMGPAGFKHEVIGANILFALKKFVSEHKLGIVCGSSAGYWMKSGNLRSPDVSFIGKERLQKFEELPEGFFQGSPDLAVEILSPSDTIEGIHGKITEYFENDTKLVWIVNPKERTILIYRFLSHPDKLLTDKDVLDGGEVLKNFSLPVAEIFVELP